MDIKPVIKTLQEEDFDKLLSLIKEFSRFEKKPELVTNSLSKMLQEKECITGYGLWWGKLLIGYTTYFFTYHTWSGKGLYLEDLFVTENYRGKGYGETLFNRVLQTAKENNCHDVRWLVSTWNTDAKQFYNKKGASITHSEEICKIIL